MNYCTIYKFTVIGSANQDVSLVVRLKEIKSAQEEKKSNENNLNKTVL